MFRQFAPQRPVFIVGVVGLLCSAACSSPTAAGGADTIDFQREIWTIFQRACVECHGAQRQKSSFRVDSRAALIKGGEIGAAIVAGDPANSYLLQLVAEGDGDLRMPPQGDRLTAAEVARIRQWISEGAVWPEAAQRTESTPGHWAFQPVKRPVVPPAPASSVASRNPIDAFLAKELAVHGLQMSRPAEPRALIRRLSLDLTGLPPTSEDVAAFERSVASSDPGSIRENQAYRELIDRLLQSPRYGERWAQHWLDVIRYADTTGYEKNDIRPSAWPYRDYVIGALNADIPYPQFILEQLAGDQFGVDAATGFLVTPPFPSRIEIGQEAAAIAQARFNGLDEVIQNVGSAVLGLTIGCARCHDHKFDPVSARDYYRFAANFAGLQFVDRPWQAGKQPTDEIIRARQRLEELRRQLAAFPSWRENEPIQSADTFLPILAKGVRVTVSSTVQRYPAAFDEVEIWTPAAAGEPPRNVASSQIGAKARSSGANSTAGGSDAHLNDGLRGYQSLWIGTNATGGGKGFGRGNWIEINFPEPTIVNRVVWSCDHDDQGPDSVPLRWRYVTDWTIEVATEDGTWQPVVTADRHEGLTKDERAARNRLEQEFAEAATDLWNLTHVFAGRFRSQLAPMHVLRRGDPQQPRDPVGPGGIDVLAGYESPPDTAERHRREALAKWLVSPSQPLTARVLVNRVWRHHFGAGLVDTPSDFGTQGERPTHPELLDWLASEFVASGWRLKELHKLICTSAAYCQSSEPSTAAREIDADSRLLWRFPPRRLEAEAIRDSILSTSGSLNFAMGGPGVNVFQPRANDGKRGEWAPFDNPGPQSWRRSIYLLRVRGGDDGVFKPFDVPDCGQVRAKRSVSTTPLQALNLINSPFVIEQAERLASRVAGACGNDLDRQVECVFQMTLARPPSPTEWSDCLQVAKEHGLSTVCRALFNCSEFLFLE